MINILLMQDMIVGGARIEGGDAITPMTAEALACLATYEMVVGSLPFLEKPSYADNGSLSLPPIIFKEPQTSDVKLATEKALFDLLRSASSDLTMENMLEAVVRPG